MNSAAPSESIVASEPFAPAPPNPFPVRLPLLLLALALLLCIVGYVALAVPADWFPSATTKAWSIRELAVTRGRAVTANDALLIGPSDASNTIIVSLAAPFRSASYPVIAWAAYNIPENAEVRLLWSNDYAPAKVNAMPIPVVSGRLKGVSPASDPNWVGNITGIALAIQATFPQPISVSGARARPMGALEVLTDRFKEWFTFEGWRGTSINTLAGGADLQELRRPVLLAVAVVLAAVMWSAWAYRAGRLDALPVTIGVLFFAAWCIADVQWMWNLTRQAAASVAQFAGKDAHQRRLDAEDGPLFAFIEHARSKLPATPVRVFMMADADYFRGRGAYHLYPYNVYFDPYRNILPPPERMHAGDYVVVYQRHGVQYDASEKRLRWDTNPPIKAELLLAEAGGALFRIL